MLAEDITWIASIKRLSENVKNKIAKLCTKSVPAYSMRYCSPKTPLAEIDWEIMTGAINKLMLANTFTPNFTIGLIIFILPSPFMNETSTYFSIASLQNFQLQTNLITNVIKLLCSKFFLNSNVLFCSFLFFWKWRYLTKKQKNRAWDKSKKYFYLML